MKKGENFEKLFNEIQVAVDQLEQNNFSIDESIAKYKEATGKIVKARKMLERMELQISKISAK